MTKVEKCGECGKRIREGHKFVWVVWTLGGLCKVGEAIPLHERCIKYPMKNIAATKTEVQELVLELKQRDNQVAH